MASTFLRPSRLRIAIKQRRDLRALIHLVRRVYEICYEIKDALGALGCCNGIETSKLKKHVSIRMLGPVWGGGWTKAVILDDC